MSSCITNYNITFRHPNIEKLKKILDKQFNQDYVYVLDRPKKKKGDKLFISKISVVAEETEVFSFTDLLSEAQESDCLLELGGTFQDPSGKGYLDSFGLKDYTEIN